MDWSLRSYNFNLLSFSFSFYLCTNLWTSSQLIFEPLFNARFPHCTFFSSITLLFYELSNDLKLFALFSLFEGLTEAILDLPFSCELKFGVRRMFKFWSGWESLSNALIVAYCAASFIWGLIGFKGSIFLVVCWSGGFSQILTDFFMSSFFKAS